MRSFDFIKFAKNVWFWLKAQTYSIIVTWFYKNNPLTDNEMKFNKWSFEEK